MVRVVDALPRKEGLYIREYESEDDVPESIRRDYGRHTWDKEGIRYHSKEAEDFWVYWREMQKENKQISFETIRVKA